MGRFYSLKVPSNIEGVSTTIDVSMGAYQSYCIR